MTPSQQRACILPPPMVVTVTGDQGTQQAVPMLPAAAQYVAGGTGVMPARLRG